MYAYTVFSDEKSYYISFILGWRWKTQNFKKASVAHELYKTKVIPLFNHDGFFELLIEGILLQDWEISHILLRFLSK